MKTKKQSNKTKTQRLYDSLKRGQDVYVILEKRYLKALSLLHVPGEALEKTKMNRIIVTGACDLPILVKTKILSKDFCYGDCIKLKLDAVNSRYDNLVHIRGALRKLFLCKCKREAIKRYRNSLKNKLSFCRKELRYYNRYCNDLLVLKHQIRNVE